MIPFAAKVTANSGSSVGMSSLSYNVYGFVLFFLSLLPFLQKKIIQSLILNHNFLIKIQILLNRKLYRIYANSVSGVVSQFFDLLFFSDEVFPLIKSYWFFLTLFF